ncbi:MAG: histidine kinase [Bacteroidia bacterium]|nr:histidine kinase [Bacteroidia bacterium]
MVKKLIIKLLKSPYFWTGILLFSLVSVYSYHKEKQVEKDASLKIEKMVQSICISNISTFKTLLLHRTEQMKLIRDALRFSEKDLQQAIVFFAQEDSLIRNLTITDQNNNADYLIKPILNNASKCIRISIPTETGSLQNKTLTLDIPLHDLHREIAENKSFSYAYLTLSHNNIYIFHPDESKIGLPVEPKNQFNPATDKEKTITQVFSDYLSIPVDRYYERAEIGGEIWTFTANVPGISFTELVINTRNAFVYMALLAAAAFIVIFLLGILHWQKEFLKRQQVQEEKINLELKNEYQKQQALATELEQLKSGLNPHFLFNSLSSLKVLVSKQPDEAKNFAVALSNLYRYLLKQEKCNLISLHDELKFTEDYIYLQQIRFSNRINVKINIDENSLNKKVPPMALQLLVENCIKHTKMSGKQPLEIEIYTNSHYLIVKNNYNPPENIPLSGKGLENLIKRYSHLTVLSCTFHIKENEFVAEIPFL